MMFGRPTRMLIPTLNQRQKKANQQREKRKRAVKKYHDKRARDLPYLRIGQSVYFEHKAGERWILGKVLKVFGDYTYLVQSQNGGKYQRNRVHIRPTQVQATIRDQSPIRSSVDKEPVKMQIYLPHPQSGNQTTCTDISGNNMNQETKPTDQNEKKTVKNNPSATKSSPYSASPRAKCSETPKGLPGMCAIRLQICSLIIIVVVDFIL